MAVPIVNPQEPQEPTLRHESYSSHNSKPLKKKPSRTLLYIRNRASPSNIGVLVVGIILTVLIIHRSLSIYMTHRRWLNAPITYIQRTCPAPTYDVVNLNVNNNSEHDAKVHSRVCLTTLTDRKSTSRFQRFLRWRDYDGILDLTLQNRKKYAQKHGYRLFDLSQLIDTSRPPAWSKIPAVQYLLQSDQCDWVLWTDADTVIMNSDVRVEDFLPSDTTHDLLVGSDNGGGYNSGVFVLRNTEWSRNFLDQWWNMTDYVRPPGFSLSGDNNALNALLLERLKQDEFDAKVLVPPRCTFNSFAQFLTVSESTVVMDSLTSQEWYMSEDYYHKSDFIAHTPGYDNKAECIRLLLQEAQ